MRVMKDIGHAWDGWCKIQKFAEACMAVLIKGYHMKHIFLLLITAITLSSCITPTHVSCRHIRARLTCYNKWEDRFRDKIAMGGKAKEGVTLAAPVRYSFGTRVTIPVLAGKIGDGIFEVQDRGRDINRLKASGGIAEVFDIYLECRNRTEAHQRTLQFEQAVGDWAEVYF